CSSRQLVNSGVIGKVADGQSWFRSSSTGFPTRWMAWASDSVTVFLFASTMMGSLSGCRKSTILEWQRAAEFRLMRMSGRGGAMARESKGVSAVSRVLTVLDAFDVEHPFLTLSGI